MVSAFRSVPAHRRHLRHHRGAAARLPRRRSRLVQPRPGAARDRPAAGRARRASTTSPSTSTTRSTRRSPASGSCARRSPASTTGSTGAGMPSQYSAENVSVSGGGRAALTRAAASLGAHQPRPLPARLHRLRGAARHLQGVHGHPDPARGRARLRLHRRRPAPRGARAAACRRCCCRTRATPPASWCAATSWRAGSALARELDCALLLDEFYSHYIWTGRPGRSCRWRAPRATSRTSTAIRWCSSTA